ncbi:Acetyl esterase/lipase [Faunimonas pinastri]|uniref:Acetyl esterase/lipase n=1 Tax=Faunimonas pinastri TaxID=1855383 RepID=A0A1H9LHS3_9HYPH|nr:alpha/beta hydrolase fold domain-containing protein [Faunimonas pinastri]SER10928.1 Acetyl esterase/lipase [Faunimonas pinastri]
MNAIKLTRTTALALVLLSGTALAQSAPQTDAQKTNSQETVKDKVQNAVRSVTGNPLAEVDTDMKHVLDAMAAMKPKPLPDLGATEARQQPTAADGANQVLREQGKSTLPDPAVMRKNILVDGGKEKIVATVFKPANASGPLPVIVYYHGGGFVIANNSTYAASAELLAKEVGAVVVSVEYSKAPEHKFPAAHDDAVAAYKWVTQNAASIGGDPQKIAVAGESAGGNLAVNVAIAARDQNLTKPLHELIVYPMAGTNLDTDSYKMADSSNVKPLNKPMMGWFYKNLVNSDADMQDPRLDIVGKADLHGLAPATVIADQIDPLQSEDLALADKLKQAGVQVNLQNYDGVTHEFFGMGKVVAKAKQAEDVAVKDMKDAFAAK